MSVASNVIHVHKVALAQEWETPHIPRVFHANFIQTAEAAENIAMTSRRFIQECSAYHATRGVEIN